MDGRHQRIYRGAFHSRGLRESAGEMRGEGGQGGEGAETLPLRVAAIFIVMLVSMLGCSIPIMSLYCGGGRWSALQKPKYMTLLKCLSAGVIAAVGFVHTLPEAVYMLEPVTPYPLAFAVALCGVFLVLVLELCFDHIIQKFTPEDGVDEGPPPTTSDDLISASLSSSSAFGDHTPMREGIITAFPASPDDAEADADGATGADSQHQELVARPPGGGEKGGDHHHHHHHHAHPRGVSPLGGIGDVALEVRLALGVRDVQAGTTAQDSTNSTSVLFKAHGEGEGNGHGHGHGGARDGCQAQQMELIRNSMRQPLLVGGRF
jgi:hypothetical protein